MQSFARHLPYSFFLLLFVTIVFAHKLTMVGSFFIPKAYTLILGSLFLFTISLMLNIFDNNKTEFSFSCVHILLLLNIMWITLTTPHLFARFEGVLFFCELAFLFLSFVIYQDIHDNQWYDAKIAKFFLLVGITGFFQALYGMLQFGLAKTLMVDLTAVKTVLRGTFGPSNAYGAFLGIGIFSIIYISLSKKCYAKTMIAILPICLGAFLLNRSRGAWFSLLLSLVIFIFLLNAYKLKTFMCQKKWFRNKIIMYSLLVIILGGGLISLFYFLYRMDLGSSYGRLYALRIALQMIKDNPVCGIGVGQFEKYFLLYQKSFLQEPQHAQWIHHAAALQTPNNHYVLTLCESGFVGLILQFSLIVISFKYLVKNLKDNNVYTAILCLLFMV